jgi:glycosyltransferase involved in cell wall biosynthesis
MALLQDSDLSQRLGHKARERAVERFSWQRIAREQEAVYDRVLEGKGGKGEEAKRERKKVTL